MGCDWHQMMMLLANVSYFLNTQSAWENMFDLLFPSLPNLWIASQQDVVYTKQGHIKNNNNNKNNTTINNNNENDDSIPIMNSTTLFVCLSV